MAPETLVSALTAKLVRSLFYIYSLLRLTRL